MVTITWGSTLSEAVLGRCVATTVLITYVGAAGAVLCAWYAAATCVVFAALAFAPGAPFDQQDVLFGALLLALSPFIAFIAALAGFAIVGGILAIFIWLHTLVAYPASCGS